MYLGENSVVTLGNLQYNSDHNATHRRSLARPRTAGAVTPQPFCKMQSWSSNELPRFHPEGATHLTTLSLTFPSFISSQRAT